MASSYYLYLTIQTLRSIVDQEVCSCFSYCDVPYHWSNTCLDSIRVLASTGCDAHLRVGGLLLHTFCECRVAHPQLLVVIRHDFDSVERSQGKMARWP